ncbi:MAG: hypothetical protein QOK19_2683 [Solirubrobacteraceae bacterium]|jgi:hypothetical protein|nr:hypothetical protein [Solirubrobacteraceae bacterium]
MKDMRAMGLCVAAVFVAGSGATATSALAAGPEFQGQNKKTKVFEPLKKAVAFKESGSGSTLASASGTELTCTASSGKGKLTGPKALTQRTTYSGCETAGATKCQSGKTPGEIKSAKLTGTLVYASKGSVLVPAIELAPPPATPMLKYKCGTTKSAVWGHVLGAIGPLEEPTTELTETFAEGAEPEPGCGTQEIQLVEGIGPCRHLELEPEPAAKVKATSTTEVKKKELTGTVSLLK